MMFSILYEKIGPKSGMQIRKFASTKWNNYISIVHILNERKNSISALIEFLRQIILK